MKKVIVITLVAVAATIILLSAVAKSQIQAEQPERMQPTVTTAAVTTAFEAKEKIKKHHFCLQGFQVQSGTTTV